MVKKEVACQSGKTLTRRMDFQTPHDLLTLLDTPRAFDASIF
jgi:hypothetical protein